MDYTYSMLDAFVPLAGDESAQCRCKRGAQVRDTLNLLSSHLSLIVLYLLLPTTTITVIIIITNVLKKAVLC